MRFAQHLSSHLTPEWRIHYMNYEALKKLVYQMVSCDWTKEDDAIDELVHSVDTNYQDQFFNEIQRQLENVNSFYRAREAELSHQLHHLQEEVEVLTALHSNPRTRQMRSTERKRRTLIQAYCEFYLHLTLLQNFQHLNYTGFRKILKKHDKLSQSDRGSKYFKQIIGKSYFYTSKEMNRLISLTEETTIMLENGNRGRAMSKLRVPPLGGDPSQWVSFLTGWLMGAICICVVAAIVIFVFRILDRPWSPHIGVLLGLRSYFNFTLWFFAFSINTFGWRRAGVNNVLIFEFNPRNHLSFQQLFEVASLMGVIFSIGLLIFLFSDWLNIPEYIGPLFIWVLTLIIFFLPLPIFYHQSRIWLMKELGRVALAPFFPVTFPDFWIADQLNSLAIILLDVEYFICYLVYGLHTSPDAFVQCGTIVYGIRPIVAVLPAWWRFAQCIRRYYDSRQAVPHLVNAGKYSTSFFVVFFSSLAAGLKAPDVSMQSYSYYIVFSLWIISAIISSCYTFAWDIRMDWGLFEKGHIIREELIYPHKVYYVLAVIEDMLLRWVWTLTISVGEGGSKILNDNIFKTVLAALEIFRRFVWNFFRLENEHLNNCGEFRVVRDISVHPLDPSEVFPDDIEGETGGAVINSIKRKTSFLISEVKPINSLIRRRVPTTSRHNEVELPPTNNSRDIPVELANNSRGIPEELDCLTNSDSEESINRSTTPIYDTPL